MLSQSESIAQKILKPNQPQVKLLPGHCLGVLNEMESSYIDMVLTDPPYFLDGLDDAWKKGNGGKRGTGAVGGLPIGMKFDVNQGIKLQKFMEPIAEQLFRIIKPGGFVLMFSVPRLYHRMAVAVEDAGFQIRDQYAWRFTKRSQFKAFSMDHFVRKRDGLSAKKKESIIKELEGRKTPQLRPQFESILCAQKPREGTFVENWLKHGTGLIDPKQMLHGMVPATVMTVEKPDKQSYNSHLTPKPIRLCEHLIRLFTRKKQIVLDPFVGSGTTCIAAFKSQRHSIGIDINKEYLKIANQRILEEAVLDVLLEMRHEDECLGAAEISRRTGIFRKSGEGDKGAPIGMNDAMVTGLLIKLVHSGRVRRCMQSNGRRGYELTDDEFETRRDDV